MKKTHIRKSKLVCLALIIAVISAWFSFSSFAADDDFESQIAAFPESYKPYLRELHETYPNWQFVPMFTYLDFNEVVDNEIGEKSLVQNSASSDIFKSREPGDYNSSTGQYIYKDGGFVEANRLAVDYFMDPRNFLNPEGIFQFELLTFSENITVEAVEKVLKGSFMYNKKIEYYNTSGKKKTDSRTYAEVIYSAGEENNINPCYLASKILNEVGTIGSQSVTGKHSTYPGIYNFYNIGATDGEGAIARGLKWASTGTDYLRPWKTPMRSIKGGAQYIAEKYIGKGQYTGYLQRFNVNPESSYPLYIHQYMTNLTGALSQGYTTYVSYESMGMLDDAIVFSIPVYENMPCADSNQGEVSLFDSMGQTGTISASYTRVRLGPSTDNHEVLKNSSGVTVGLSMGHELKILEKVKTDSTYFASVLQYPYWYKVEFVVSDKTYTGYVSENFIELSTGTKVAAGTYDLSMIKTNPFLELSLVSSNSSVAKVVDNDTVEFLKKGTAYITAYDSLGRFDKVKFVVTDSSAAPEKVKVKSLSSTSAKVSFTPTSAEKHEITVVKKNTGEIVFSKTVTASSCKITKLISAASYDICVRAVIDENNYSQAVIATLETNLDAVNITKLVKNEAGKYSIFWDKLTDISGYAVYSFDPMTNKYTLIQEVSPSAASFTVPDSAAAATAFALRCFKTVDGESYYGDYSTVVFTDNLPDAKVTGIKVDSVTSDGYKIRWDKVEDYKYRLYKDGKRVTSSSATEYEAKGLGYSALSSYRVSLFRKIDSVVYEGAYSEAFTAATKPAKVSGLKATKTPDGGVLTWDNDTAVSYFDVYVYDYSAGKYIKTAKVKTNTYTVTSQGPSVKVKAKVLGYISTTYTTNKGESTAVSFYSSPEIVTGVKTGSITNSSYKLSWSSAKGANKYCIYRYDTSKDKFVKIASTKKTSYTLKGMEAGTVHRYKIRAVYLENGKIITSSYTPEHKFATLPSKVANVKASDVTDKSATLTWDSCKGATKYCIYQYNSKTKKFVLIAAPSGTSYSLSSLTGSTTYKLRIKALIKADGIKYYGQSVSVNIKTK